MLSYLFALLHIFAAGGSLAPNDTLKVNKHMQVEGFDNIYAVGDCANVNEPKMAYHAGLHANVAATNVINSLSGKPLVTYKTGKGIMFLHRDFF